MLYLSDSAGRFEVLYQSWWTLHVIPGGKQPHGLHDSTGIRQTVPIENFCSTSYLRFQYLLSRTLSGYGPR